MTEEVETVGDDRPNVYYEADTGKWVYRASSLGNCIQGLVATRIGMSPMPHPDWLLRAFAQGHRNEPVILKMLVDQGEWRLHDEYELKMYDHLELEGGQVKIEIPVGDGAIIRGHTDGIGECYVTNKTKGLTSGVRRVVEAKAFSKSLFAKYEKQGLEAFPYYTMQAAIYMHATNLPLLFVVGEKDDDGVVQRIRVDNIDLPPLGLGAIKAKVARIEAMAQANNMPGCDFEQYPCQFYYLHDDERQAADKNRDAWGSFRQPEADAIETTPELEHAALTFDEGRKMEAEGKKLKEEGKKGILEWIGNNVDKMGGIIKGKRVDVKVDQTNIAERQQVVKEHVRTNITVTLKGEVE